jgi:hypothetical protein
MDEVEEEVPQQEEAAMPGLRYRMELRNPLINCVVRIPNKFERAQIQEHAMAARALRIRQLKDVDSRAYLAVESRLEGYEEGDDDAMREMLVNRELRTAAAKAQLKIEYADHEKNPEWREFANIAKLQSTYQRMLADGTDNGEEFEALQAILVDYANALESEVDELLMPIRAATAALDREGLLAETRKVLLRDDADEHFVMAHSKYEIWFGTKKLDDDSKFYFASIEELENTEEAVIELLEQQFNSLSVVKSLDPKVSAPTPSSPSSESPETSEIGE